MSISTSTERLAAVALFLGAVFSSAAAQQRPDVLVAIDARRTRAEISPLLYGQFAEFMFEGVKGGLHAELLKNRGFDEPANAIGLSRYWERYPDDRNDDYGLNFRWDDSVFMPVSTAFLDHPVTQHSLRIMAGRGVVERHGVFQSRVPVRAGVGYRAYVWLKSENYTGPVRIALEQDIAGGRSYAEAEVTGISGDWQQYAVTLRPSQADPLARFVILTPGRGRLWIDQVSLMPEDAIASARADVVQHIAAVKPAFIRWPGGNVAQDYHWQWGIGPRDRRPVWTNLSWKNEPEPSDFGTDEFIALARHVGAEPTITVNVEGRGATPEEAAQWVEYANGPATSKFGALRAANGHPEPYNLKIWEIGNEIWGDWVRGHSDAETYARNFLAYRHAMLAVDPTLKFIAVGDNDMKWNRTVLRLAGSGIDYLAIHHYYGSNEQQRARVNLMAHPLFYEKFYQDVARAIRELVPGRAIQLAINEWGLNLPESRQYSMDAALYGARMLNVFERSSPLVAMSAVSDMVNGWPGGIIQASRHDVFVSPFYYVNQLYADHRGDVQLAADVRGPTFDATLEGRAVPVVDVVASRSRDGRVFVKLINTSADRDLETRVRITGGQLSATGEWLLLTADDARAYNSFQTPHAIEPRKRALTAGNDFVVNVPKNSVSLITLYPGARRDTTDTDTK